MKQYKKAYIEITNVCNLCCSFCAKTNRMPEFMPIKRFEKIIEQVAPLTDYLYFHLMGEPLLHMELKQLLKIAEGYNKKVVITTNGTLISEKSDVLLNSSAVYKVAISLHSFEANSGQLSLESYLKAIVNFAKTASKASEIITAIRLWNLDSESMTGGNSLNGEILDFLQKQFGLRDKITAESFSQRDLKLSERVFLQTAERFEWPDMNREVVSEKAFCYGLRDHFGILVDGTVVPCCLDHDGEIPLGNCLNSPLAEILKSERAMRIFNGFSNRIASEELCKKCGYISKFK